MSRCHIHLYDFGLPAFRPEFCRAPSRSFYFPISEIDEGTGPGECLGNGRANS